MFVVYGIYDDDIAYGYFETVYGDSIDYTLNTDISEWMIPGTMED